jgi:hypothetical protein
VSLQLQQLIDRAEITDVLVRYTTGVDDQDWDRLDTVFTADAQIDYTESGGIAAAYPDVKAWLAQNLPAFSQHYLHTLGQVAIAFADGGDEAEVTAYFHNPMRVADGAGGEKVVEVGGTYRHAMVRTAEGWRSRRLHEQVVWTRGF